MNKITIRVFVVFLALGAIILTTVTWAATATGGFIMGGSSSANITASAVCSPNGGVCNSTLTTKTALRMPFNATLNNLYAAQGTAPTSGSSCILTLRSSAGCTAPYSSTPLSCSITPTSNLTCNNTSSTASVLAGDCIQVQFTEVGSCSGFINWGFQVY